MPDASATTKKELIARFITIFLLPSRFELQVSKDQKFRTGFLVHEVTGHPFPGKRWRMP
jgi:hypothetical protein